MLDKSPTKSPVNVPNDLAAHWMPFTANRAFKKAPRLLAGAKLGAADESESVGADWSRITAGPWLRETLEQSPGGTSAGTVCRWKRSRWSSQAACSVLGHLSETGKTRSWRQEMPARSYVASRALSADPQLDRKA